MSEGLAIPSDAIEVAAAAIVTALLADSTDKYTYVSVGAAHRVQLDGAFDLRAAARAALEAAAPHLRAQAFDEAASKLRNDMEVPQRIWVSRKVTALAMIERGDG